MSHLSTLVRVPVHVHACTVNSNFLREALSGGAWANDTRVADGKYRLRRFRGLTAWNLTLVLLPHERVVRQCSKKCRFCDHTAGIVIHCISEQTVRSKYREANRHGVWYLRREMSAISEGVAPRSHQRKNATEEDGNGERTRTRSADAANKTLWALPLASPSTARFDDGVSPSRFEEMRDSVHLQMASLEDRVRSLELRLGTRTLNEFSSEHPTHQHPHHHEGVRTTHVGRNANRDE